MPRFKVIEKSVEEITRFYEVEAACSLDAKLAVENGLFENYDFEAGGTVGDIKYEVEFIGESEHDRLASKLGDFLREVERSGYTFQIDEGGQAHVVKAGE